MSNHFSPTKTVFRAVIAGGFAAGTLASITFGASGQTLPADAQPRPPPAAILA